jgi:hypothetical protein
VPSATWAAANLKTDLVFTSKKGAAAAADAANSKADLVFTSRKKKTTDAAAAAAKGDADLVFTSKKGAAAAAANGDADLVFTSKKGAAAAASSGGEDLLAATPTSQKKAGVAAAEASGDAADRPGAASTLPAHLQALMAASGSGTARLSEADLAAVLGRMGGKGTDDAPPPPPAAARGAHVPRAGDAGGRRRPSASGVLELFTPGALQASGAVRSLAAADKAKVAAADKAVALPVLTGRLVGRLCYYYNAS